MRRHIALVVGGLLVSAGFASGQPRQLAGSLVEDVEAGGTATTVAPKTSTPSSKTVHVSWFRKLLPGGGVNDTKSAPSTTTATVTKESSAAQAPAEETKLPAPTAVSSVAAPAASAPLPEAPAAPAHEDHGHAADLCAPAPCAPHAWGSAEYLYWWIKSMSLPIPVATTGPANPATAGSLADPNTQVLFGNTTLNSNHQFSGGRFTAGYWLGSESKLGVEGSFLFLARQTFTDFQAPAFPNGIGVLAQPIVNAATGAEVAALTSFPGAFTGSMQVTSSSSLWGYEANTSYAAYRGANGYVTPLAGFRYLDLAEDLAIGSQRSALANGQGNFLGNPVFNDGSVIAINDDFHTRNQFYGGQLGARAEFRRGRASVNLVAKAALGTMHQTVDINGGTQLFPPSGVPAGAVGGLLAQPTNIGHHTRDQFAVVPEGTLTLGYNLTTRIRATVGYTFLYMSSVVRPGDQIDRTVNITQPPSSPQFSNTLTGPARPAFNFNTTDFWAQGVNLGVWFSF